MTISLWGGGSVVTRSFKESNIVIAGNPARKISTWEEYREKYEGQAAFRSELLEMINTGSEKLVKK